MKKLSIVALLLMSAIAIVPTGVYAKEPVNPPDQVAFKPIEMFNWTGAEDISNAGTGIKTLILTQPRTGKFTVTFKHKDGKQMLNISKVEAYVGNTEGESPVSVDEHAGITGWSDDQNVYTLDARDSSVTRIVCHISALNKLTNGTITLADKYPFSYPTTFSPLWEGSKDTNTDAEWSDGQNWIALPAGTRPSSNKTNFLLDGRIIGDKITTRNNYKTVNLNTGSSLQNLKIGLYRGTHLTAQIHQIQITANNTGTFYVDDSSKLTVTKLTNAKEGPIDIHIKPENGITFPSNWQPHVQWTVTFNLYLYERGRLVYPGILNPTFGSKQTFPHHIKALTLNVGAGDMKKVATRKLISFASVSKSQVTFNADDAVITLMPEATTHVATKKATILDPLVDPVGTCYFSKKADGYYVDYIVAVASTEDYTTTLEAPTATWDTIQWQNGGIDVDTPASFVYATLDFAVPTSTSLDIGETPSTDQATLTFTGTGDLALTNPTIPASYDFANMMGQVTLNSETGSANIIAGTDTILTQRGEGGTLTVGEGKKVTLPNTYQGTLTSNLGSISSHGAALTASDVNTFKTGSLILAESTNTTIDVRPVNAATTITQPITGAGNLIFQARGTATTSGSGTYFGSITNAAGCTGSLTIATGLLDIDTTSAHRDNLPKGKIILVGGSGLRFGTIVKVTLSKDIGLQDGTSYIRGQTTNVNSALTLTGSLSGSEKAILQHTQGGYLVFNGDLSGYKGKILINTNLGHSGLAITTTAATTYNEFPGSIQSAVGQAKSMRFNIGRDLTLSGIISGTSPLIKNHAAKLTLTGANTLTGAIQVTDGTLHASTLSLGAAPVSLATAAKALNIDLTDVQYTDLTTRPFPVVPLCSITGEISTFKDKTFLYYNGILVNDATNTHEIAFTIIDQKLYAIKDRDSAQLFALAGDMNWTTAPWLDESDIAISDWTMPLGFLTLTAPTTGNTNLTLDQNVIATSLSILPSENGTGTLAIRQDINAYTLTTPNIDASTTTHAVTLDFNTGITNIQAGADTIFTQAGTGALTIGPNKKATLSTNDWLGTITLAGEPISTNLATLNAAMDINVPSFTTTGPFALSANQNKTFTIADVTSFSNHDEYSMYITGEGTVKLSTKFMRRNGVIVNAGATLDLSRIAGTPVSLFHDTEHIGGPNVFTFTVRGTALLCNWNYYNADLPANKNIPHNALGRLSHNANSVTLDGGTVIFTETFIGTRPFTVTANGGALSVIEGERYTHTANTNIVIEAGAQITLTGAGTGEIQTPITGTNASVTKRGTGIWMLEGINNYTGATNIEAGTLKIPLAQVAPTTVKTGATLAFLTGGTSGKAQMVTVEDNVTIDLSALGDEDTILGGFQLSEGVISANVNINVTGRTLVEGQTLLSWDAANVIPAGLTAILTGASDPTFFIKKVNNSLRVSKVNIVITGGDISQNVMDYLARNLTESITLTQAQANMLYLFQLPITQEALTFKVNDIQVVKGEGEAYSVIVTATLNGITLTETHNVNGSFQLLAGTSPNVVTPVQNLATKTALTNGTVSFEVPLGEDRYFKIRITDIQ